MLNWRNLIIPVAMILIIRQPIISCSGFPSALQLPLHLRELIDSLKPF